jgi:His-Xaa-Ser system radical SAM maturase HxsB
MTTAVAEPNLLDEKKVGPFNFRKLPDSGSYLITNDFGKYMMLDETQFQDFLGGRIKEDSPLFAEMKANGFLREWLDFDELTKGWKSRNQFLDQGTSLHIIVVTLRCNQKCVYCQVSSVGMNQKGTDMTPETADQVVDRIMESPNKNITIEFQGGEPLVNWPIVKRVVERATKLNRKAKKRLLMGLVSNMSLMTDDKLKFLLDHKVTFCTSLDGPAEVHDKNRIFLGGTAHADTAKWFGKIYDKTRRKKFRIDALTTITKHSLKYPKEIVDEYVRLGARGIYLRPLTPLGLAVRTWETIGYTPAEFMEFYKTALDYIIELNLKSKKVKFFEHLAKTFLHKILNQEEPNHLDIRSPCGAGIGQVAYNFDGSVYTCDEGRMLSRMGDESFRLGHVNTDGFKKMMEHPTVKTLAVASSLEEQPTCSTCAYKPYDGVCPIYNYASQGDIFGRMHSNQRCRTHMGVLDLLFEKMKDAKVKAVFKRWVAKSGKPEKEISNRH